MPLMLFRRSRCVFRNVSVTDSLPIAARLSRTPTVLPRVAVNYSSSFTRKTLLPRLFNAIHPTISRNYYATTTVGAVATKPRTAKKATQKKATQKKATPKKAAKIYVPPKPKQLTEKQKETKRLREKKDAIKALKEAALQPPPRGRLSGFLEHLRVVSEGRKGASAAILSKEASVTWKELPEVERQNFNRLARQHAAAGAVAFDEWVKRHTPLQIWKANKARVKLNGLAEAGKGTSQKYRSIPDDRQVKRPVAPYMFFTKERYGQREPDHLSVVERALTTAEEWRGLTADEKKKYEDMFKLDLQRYRDECKTVYGIDSMHDAKV